MNVIVALLLLLKVKLSESIAFLLNIYISRNFMRSNAMRICSQSGKQFSIPFYYSSKSAMSLCTRQRIVRLSTYSCLKATIVAPEMRWAQTPLMTSTFDGCRRIKRVVEKQFREIPSLFLVRASPFISTRYNIYNTWCYSY